MAVSTLRSEVLLPLIAAALFTAGCEGFADGELGPTPNGMGRVQASLTSATNLSSGPVLVQSSSPGKDLKVKEIIVTIAKVTAHSSEGGWQTLASKETTVDILQLAKYAQPLGFANMPKGKVTQVRLYLAENASNYVTRDDGVRVDLKVPSGLQSGIKLHGMFDVAGCALNTVPIQFDGKRSIWVHPTGQGDLWILRPVIRMGKVEATGVGCTENPVNPLDPINPGTPGGGGTGGGGTGGGTGGGSGSTGGAGGGAGTIGGTGGGTGGGFIEGGGTPGTGGSTGSGGTVTPGGTLGGTGAACDSSLACLSGTCTNRVCGVGGPDSPCRIGTDCGSNICTSGGTCGIGTAGGTGATCTANSQCLSNGCVNGVCGSGSQGQPCAAAGDCAIGFVCSAGACTAMIN